MESRDHLNLNGGKKTNFNNTEYQVMEPSAWESGKLFHNRLYLIAKDDDHKAIYALHFVWQPHNSPSLENREYNQAIPMLYGSLCTGDETKGNHHKNNADKVNYGKE